MRLAGDTARAATTDEVKALRKEARDLNEDAAAVITKSLANLTPADGYFGRGRVILLERKNKRK